MRSSFKSRPAEWRNAIVGFRVVKEGGLPLASVVPLAGGAGGDLESHGAASAAGFAGAVGFPPQKTKRGAFLSMPEPQKMKMHTMHEAAVKPLEQHQG